MSDNHVSVTKKRITNVYKLPLVTRHVYLWAIAQ
jgi:hypothetical protein